MSSIAKGVGNAVSSVGKAIGGAVKSIVSGVGKAFKKVWDSTLGRIVITAIAIYLGGWALGAWGGPTTLFGGAAATGPTTVTGTIGAEAPASLAAAAPEAAAATGAAAPTAASGLAAVPQTGSTAFLGGAAPGAAPAAAAQGGGGLIASQMAPAAVPAIDAASTTAAVAGGYTGGGISAIEAPSALSAAGIVNTIRGLGGFVKANPLVSAVGLNAAAGALTPSPEEVAAEAEKARIRRLNANTAVGGINVGAPTNKPVTDSYGKPIYDPRTGLPTAQLGRNLGALNPPAEVQQRRKGLIQSQMG